MSVCNLDLFSFFYTLVPCRAQPLTDYVFLSSSSILLRVWSSDLYCLPTASGRLKAKAAMKNTTHNSQKSLSRVEIFQSLLPYREHAVILQYKLNDQTRHRSSPRSARSGSAFIRSIPLKIAIFNTQKHIFDRKNAIISVKNLHISLFFRNFAAENG